MEQHSAPVEQRHASRLPPRQRSGAVGSSRLPRRCARIGSPVVGSAHQGLWDTLLIPAVRGAPRNRGTSAEVPERRGRGASRTPAQPTHSLTGRAGVVRTGPVTSQNSPAAREMCDMRLDVGRTDRWPLAIRTTTMPRVLNRAEGRGRNPAAPPRVAGPVCPVGASRGPSSRNAGGLDLRHHAGVERADVSQPSASAPPPAPSWPDVCSSRRSPSGALARSSP